ncbi:8435_t:CDS:1, partial [Paraglomus brasilianum]
RSDGEDQHIELSKCKFRFTIGDGDELEKLLQEAQAKTAMVDIKVAEGRLEEEELKSRKRKHEEEEEELKSRKRKREEKHEKVDDLKWKIEFWNEQGHMDKVNKFRQELYELMDD